LMIRKGMIFQNVAAFQFIRPTELSSPNPTSNDPGHSNPAHAGATELSVMDCNPVANNSVTTLPCPPPADAQQRTATPLQLFIPTLPSLPPADEQHSTATVLQLSLPTLPSLPPASVQHVSVASLAAGIPPAPSE
jgi:hypothetical protein